MAMHQGALTIIAKIKPEEVEDLRALLKGIGADVENNTIIPFAELATIHFARWVILDEAKDIHGKTIPPTLAFSTNYDAPLNKHVDQLVRVAGSGLDQIYSHCEGYPAEGHRTQDSIRPYLWDHMVDSSAFYVHARGRSVQQIRREAELRDAIEDFLDQQNAIEGWAGRDPRDVRKAIQTFVASKPSLSWARTPAPPSTLAWNLKDYGSLAGIVLGVIGMFIGLAAVLAWVIQFLFELPIFAGVGMFVLFALAPPVAWAVILRIHERRDAQRATAGNRKHVLKIAEREDHMGQNQMTRVDDVKPGWFRRFTLRLVLFVANIAARYVFTRGELVGVSTIHFARWIIIDRGRRLIFFSNYDGSWENYVGDFVDRAARGLTAIWGNTYGCPNARWLILDGAREEQGFKRLTRDVQLPTEVWYSAYKRLSAANLGNNTKIREGLGGDLDLESTREWLRRL